MLQICPKCQLCHLILLLEEWLVDMQKRILMLKSKIAILSERVIKKMIKVIKDLLPLIELSQFLIVEKL